MKFVRNMIIALMLPLFFVETAHAGDFGWMQDLTIEAKGDLSRYRARLSSRFRIGNAEIDVVLGKVSHHADAYMILRLHEMSGRSIDEVMNHYQTDHTKGWGALAKSLGIKPGSSEFHSLKQGHDLEGYSHYIHIEGSSHGKGKDKDKQNNKGKDKQNHKQ